jgi:hypothetical protein
VSRSTLGGPRGITGTAAQGGRVGSARTFGVVLRICYPRTCGQREEACRSTCLK